MYECVFDMQVGESNDVSHSQNGLSIISNKGTKLWEAPTEKEILVSKVSSILFAHIPQLHLQ